MDENITMEITECPVVNEESVLDTDPIAVMIEKELDKSEDFLCLSFKKNYEDDFKMGDEEEDVSTCQLYLNESGVATIASTAGVHFMGENRTPHVHFHAIVMKSTVPKTMISNASLHRKRSSYSVELSSITMKSTPLVARNPKFYFLSYPYKEGNVGREGNRWKGKQMKSCMIDFLRKIGKTLYEEQCAKNLIRERSEERRQNDYLELLNLVRDSGIQFSSFRSLQIWAEEHYIEKIPPEKMIDIVNYKKNLQKVGVALRIVKTYDL